MKIQKAKECCPFCGCDTRPVKMRAFSSMYNAWFCNQACYENHKVRRDQNAKETLSKDNLQ